VVAVKVDVLAAVAGSGGDGVQLRSGGPDIGNEVGVRGSVASAIGDEGYRQSVDIAARATVARQTGDEGISDPIGGDGAWDGADEDEVLRGVRVVTHCLDVDELAAAEAGEDGVLDGGGAVGD